MPRLSHSTYAAQHDVLHELWVRSEGRAFAVVSAAEQWDLHEFFAVTTVLSESGLREHRALATKHDPSLPHRAGRALKKLNERLAVEAARMPAQEVVVVTKPGRPKRKYRKNANRVMRVRSVVHPEPDVEKFAQVLLELAKEMAEKERHERQRDTDAA